VYFGRASDYFLYFFKKLNGELRGGISEHVDADSELGFPLGLLHEITFYACKASALDAHLAANLQAGGVDGDRCLGIANHTLEVEHLAVGNHGNISLAADFDKNVFFVIIISGYKLDFIRAFAFTFVLLSAPQSEAHALPNPVEQTTSEAYADMKTV